MADIDSDLSILLPSFELTADTGVELNVLLPSLVVDVDILLTPEAELTIVLPTLNIVGETGTDGHLLLPVLMLSGSTLSAGSAELSITLPKFKLAGSALLSSVGSVTLTLPRLNIHATTISTYSANVSIILPSVKISSTLSFPNADLLITLPNLVLQGILFSTFDVPNPLSTTQEFRTFRLNLDNAALSVLTYNAIKGHVVLHDVEYVATADGLYSIGGKSFGGYAIEWNIQTPLLDFGLPGNKRLRAVKFGGEFKDVLNVVVSADEGVQHKYSTTPIAKAVQDGIQAYISRQIQGRYLKIGVMGEGEMAVDAIEAIPILTGRRAR